MSHALRLVTLRRGHDPRDFAFIAYGGAGPLHAALLARELGISRTIIPPGPGHFSAFGMLAGEPRGEAVHTVVGPVPGTDLARGFAPAEDAALANLGPYAQGAAMARYAELRYRGQEHTLEVPVSDPRATEELRRVFERRCLEAYSFRLDAPLEVVALRVTATAALSPVISWNDDGQGDGKPPSPSRLVDFDLHGGVTESPVLSRADLGGLDWISGPCVIEEPAATTLVLPGQGVRRDDLGNLVIEEQA
jgi:N-methylhydantoinase A